MALKQIASSKKDSDTKKCPKCGGDAIIIDGRIVRWLNCPSCKFKKLIQKDDTTNDVKVREV
jgi:ssDNA-binding Zn-finger/Zn-ribbon topoisomerase 1